MSLIVSMSAPWTASYTPSANLRLTVGMEATFSAVFTGQSNLAMIVPLGNASFSAAFTGSATMRGRLSMSASFGGATPLAQEVAAEVLAGMAASPPPVNVAQVNGYQVTGAGTAGNPWGPV